jgi:hypothetical protein
VNGGFAGAGLGFAAQQVGAQGGGFLCGAFFGAAGGGAFGFGGGRVGMYGHYRC